MLPGFGSPLLGSTGAGGDAMAAMATEGSLSVAVGTTEVCLRGLLGHVFSESSGGNREMRLLDLLCDGADAGQAETLSKFG